MPTRRRFLATVRSGCIAGVASLLAPQHALGRLVCGPYNMYNGLQSCEAGIQSDILTVKAYDTQHATEWCWAACIEMVFRYYGFMVPQERIVRDTWGRIINLPAMSPYQILQNLNRQWIDDNGKAFSVFGTAYGANPMTASQDLAANMPLIIGTLGHAMVLTALSYVRNAYGGGSVTAAFVRDPWPFQQPGVISGKRILTPQEWYSTQFLARVRVLTKK